MYVGDIQLRAFTSWIQNEITSQNQAKPYTNVEELEPLYLMPEARDPWTYYYDLSEVTISKKR